MPETFRILFIDETVLSLDYPTEVWLLKTDEMQFLV